MADPPLLGAVKATLNWALPGVMTTDVGVPGVVLGVALVETPVE